MMFSKEYLDSISRWEHKVNYPKPPFSSLSAPKVYDVFTIHFKSLFKPREKIVAARNVTKIDNVWQHIPTEYAQNIHSALKQIGQNPPMEIYGPQKIE